MANCDCGCQNCKKEIDTLRKDLHDVFNQNEEIMTNIRSVFWVKDLFIEMEHRIDLKLDKVMDNMHFVANNLVAENKRPQQYQNRQGGLYK